MKTTSKRCVRIKSIKNRIKMKEKINPHKKTFEGIVKKIVKPTAIIEFQRTIYHSKYERFSKSKTKIKARIPSNLLDKIKINDLVVAGECQPISKTIHHVIKSIKSNQPKNKEK